MEKLNIYITGPNKYYPNGLNELKMMRSYAELYGFNVINDFSYIENGHNNYEKVTRDHLDNCDIVIADVNPFRGGEPESGTIFDIGVAYAKNKKIYTYVRDMRNIIHKYPFAKFDEDGKIVDLNGLSFPDGQTPGNLMYMVPSKMVEGGFIESIKLLLTDLHEEDKDKGQRVTPKVDNRSKATWPVEEGQHRAYLAGTELFSPDRDELGVRMKASCEKYNFQGIYPPDKTPDFFTLPPEQMKNLYTRCAYVFDKNQLHIRNSNMVIANLNPHHGHEPDSGTVFEVAMGFGLGYPVYAYINDGRPLVDRIPCHKGEDGLYRDVEGFVVEDYGFQLAAKLATTITVSVGDFDAAAKTAAIDQGIYR